MRGERGQITLFVIIGLVVLFVIGLFFLLAASRARQDDARAGTGAVIDDASAAAVSSAIAACLDAVMTDELKLIGETGALPSVDGYPSGIVPYGTRERRIIYGITANRNEAQDPPSVTILPIAYPPPRYPDEEVTVEKSDHYYDDDLARLVRFDWFQDGYFGDVNFPAICDADGGNGPGTPFRCRSYPGMPPGTMGPSIEEQLRSRVTQRMQSCASPRALSDALGQTVTTVESPRVNLTFTPNTILLTLTYRIELEGSRSATLTTTPRTYSLRLMPLLQFATALSRQETRNVTFNLSRDYERLPEWKPGFSVFRTTVEPSGKTATLEPSLAPKADLITIIDGSSVLDGASYPFSFLVEHRPPMLDPLLISRPGQGEEPFTIAGNDVLNVEIEEAKEYLIEFDVTAGPIRPDARMTVLVNLFSRRWNSPGDNNIGTIGILRDGSRAVFITKQTNDTGQDYGFSHESTFLEGPQTKPAWNALPGKTYHVTMTFDGKDRVQTYRITGPGTDILYEKEPLPELAREAGSKGLRVEFGIPRESAGDPEDGEATARGWTFKNIIIIGIGEAADPDDGAVRTVYCDGTSSDTACTALGKSVVTIDSDDDKDWEFIPTS